MIYGFTGTRKGLKKPQAHELFRLFKEYDESITDSNITLIHGGAPGADEICDSYSVLLGYEIEVHPCKPDRYLYWINKGDGVIRTIYHIEKPLIRNRKIVYKCDMLFATPSGMEEELRSGTWTTIRYARQAKKRLVIIFPDGSSYKENGEE